MIRSRLPPLRAIAAALVLAACESSGFSGGSGGAPPSYDGTWTGSAVRTSGGERACPSSTPFVVSIANGIVHGEVRDRRDRTVTTSRFDGVVDADGLIAARAWYDGTRNDLALRYNGERFAGNITNASQCSFSLRLARG